MIHLADTLIHAPYMLPGSIRDSGKLFYAFVMTNTHRFVKWLVRRVEMEETG